jgi:hypothetical protein
MSLGRGVDDLNPLMDVSIFFLILKGKKLSVSYFLSHLVYNIQKENATLKSTVSSLVYKIRWNALPIITYSRNKIHIFMEMISLLSDCTSSN